jgi:5-methylcytosine-specific restriction protein B
MKNITGPNFYKLVTKQDIEDAIKHVNDNSIQLKQSTRFNFQDDYGNLYPPKDILRYAAQLKGYKIYEDSLSGGKANKPFEKLGYKIINKDQESNNSENLMNKTLLNKYWQQYKEYFKLPESEHKEKYKWPVLKQVYDKWDWNAKDKALMFKNAFEVEGSKNIWMSGNFYPIPHSNWMFQHFKEETVAAFNYLFNEQVNLTERIENFLELYDNKVPELKKLYPDKNIEYHSHNDLRAISLYLTLQYPNKYFLFKFGVVKSYCEKLELQEINRGDKENLSNYLNIANQTLDFIKEDSSFITEYKKFTSQDDKYKDDALHLLTQDFIYTVATHFNTTTMPKNDGIKYWLYAPGVNASKWDEFYTAGIMALGWDYLGDLNQYKTKEEINKKLQKHENITSSKKNDATANYEFKDVLSVGDVVIVKRGKKEYLGYGIVTSDYYYDDTRQTFNKCRKVNWIKKGSWAEENHPIVLKTLTDITKYPDYVERLKILIGIGLNNDTMKYPLNQILYGSPGTGKTYKTKELAVNIILGKADRTREEILRLYKELIEKEQIYFTTFHQSMSYEDFIEGIKPENSNGNIIYEVKDGIFKQIVSKALSNYENSKSGNNKKTTFETAFEMLKDDWEENPEMKFPLLTKGFDYTVIGFNNSSIQFKKASGGTGHTLSIKTLRELYYGKEYNSKKGLGIYYSSILNKLSEYKDDIPETIKNEKFVLIIDEINRGNISSIFGELITLLEEDKRKDCKEVIEVILPYSNEKFEVPNNVYIIGTMNTADRSVEALDTALRRRFSFTEIQANPELLSSDKVFYNLLWKHKDLEWNDNLWINIENNFKLLFGLSNEWKKKNKEVWDPIELKGYDISNSKLLKPYILIDNIDLQKIIETINKRIELLINKDHQIGTLILWKLHLLKN